MSAQGGKGGEHSIVKTIKVQKSHALATAFGGLFDPPANPVEVVLAQTSAREVNSRFQVQRTMIWVKSGLGRPDGGILRQHSRWPVWLRLGVVGVETSGHTCTRSRQLSTTFFVCPAPEPDD